MFVKCINNTYNKLALGKTYKSEGFIIDGQRYREEDFEITKDTTEEQTQTKVKFDLEKFKKENIAINCQTEEEAREFLTYLYIKGLQWCDDRSLLKETNWDLYKEQNCYDFDITGITYCRTGFYLEQGYTIIPYSSLEFPQFSKADLETGMIVLTKKNEYCVVSDNELLVLNNRHFPTLPLRLLQDDLTYKSNSGDHSIVKVFTADSLKDVFSRNFDNLKLLWERKECQ